MANCKKCGDGFEITDKDRAFYAKMDVPEPGLCPDCRQQRRLAFRNERKLYQGTCGLCRKQMISIYSPDKPYPVYCSNCWWGDGWDPLSYGRDFDFSRPFFEQFKELYDVVPKINRLILGDNVNCDYVNDCYRLKNCYLIFDGEQGEDCMYGETFSHLTDCVDFLFLQSCQLCYECTNCRNCYNLRYSRYCDNCSDSQFLYDCKGCKNCFGCVNLRQKEYHIFNKPVPREQYEAQVAAYQLSNYEHRESFRAEVEQFFLGHPQRAVMGTMNENVTGDNLWNCKDSEECFDCTGARDCKFCTNILMGGVDSYDVNIWGENMSLCYNTAGTGASVQNVIACYYGGIMSSNLRHCIFCLKNVHDLLGCVGLHQKKFCILNKQYTEEEYNALLPRVIAHLKQTGEWAEFFPPELSPFGYNETVADEYYPLGEEDVKAQGFKWQPKNQKEYLEQTCQVPAAIAEVPETIVNEILACECCGKNYKIVVQELGFYRKHGIPIPRKCADCRHLDRLKLKNLRKLWDRQCSNCACAVKTTFAPDRPEIVYCEKCYMGSVH
jgi:hypothetical protein